MEAFQLCPNSQEHSRVSWNRDLGAQASDTFLAGILVPLLTHWLTWGELLNDLQPQFPGL